MIQSEAAFAKLYEACPIPASSGKVHQYRRFSFESQWFRGFPISFKEKSGLGCSAPDGCNGLSMSVLTPRHGKIRIITPVRKCRRQFGNINKERNGNYRARYKDPGDPGRWIDVPETSPTRMLADARLVKVEASILEDRWVYPDELKAQAEAEAKQVAPEALTVIEAFHEALAKAIKDPEDLKGLSILGNVQSGDGKPSIEDFETAQSGLTEILLTDRETTDLLTEVTGKVESAILDF